MEFLMLSKHEDYEGEWEELKEFKFQINKQALPIKIRMKQQNK